MSVEEVSTSSLSGEVGSRLGALNASLESAVTGVDTFTLIVVGSAAVTICLLLIVLMTRLLRDGSRSRAIPQQPNNMLRLESVLSELSARVTTLSVQTKEQSQLIKGDLATLRKSVDSLEGLRDLKGSMADVQARLSSSVLPGSPDYKDLNTRLAQIQEAIGGREHIDSSTSFSEILARLASYSNLMRDECSELKEEMRDVRSRLGSLESGLRKTQVVAAERPVARESAVRRESSSSLAAEPSRPSSKHSDVSLVPPRQSVGYEKGASINRTRSDSMRERITRAQESATNEGFFLD